MSAPALSLKERVSHVADFCHRYPGETVTFYTRVELSKPACPFTLQLTLPAGIVLQGTKAQLPAGTVPVVAQDGKKTYLIWQVDCEGAPDTQFDFQVSGVVSPAQDDLSLESQALLTIAGAEEEQFIEETAVVQIQAKGRYLKHLPAIYQEDELMGRLLMLYESFLDPLEKKIDNQPDYLDPALAPAQFLPWMGTWTGLPVDTGLDEQTSRKLVGSASQLMHERGTRHGLQAYLQAYTGGQVRIIEHFSENFVLGPEAKLGLGIALGTDNIPNTFSVYITAPAVSEDLDEETQLMHKRATQQKICSIIEAEKPVHTGYTIHLEFESTRKEYELRVSQHD